MKKLTVVCFALLITSFVFGYFDVTYEDATDGLEYFALEYEQISFDTIRYYGNYHNVIALEMIGNAYYLSESTLSLLLIEEDIRYTAVLLMNLTKWIVNITRTYSAEALDIILPAYEKTKKNQSFELTKTTGRYEIKIVYADSVFSVTIAEASLIKDYTQDIGKINENKSQEESYTYTRDTEYEYDMKYKDLNQKELNDELFEEVYKSNHDLEIIKALLKNGADVNSTNHYGDTLLYHAAEFLTGEIGYELIKLLIDNGADVHKKNNDGYTPLWVAKWVGDAKIIKLLQESAAK